MGFDDGTSHGKADAHADGIQLAGVLAAVEEGGANLAELFRRNAEAGILDGQDESVVGDFGREGYGTAVAVVGDGILHDDEQYVAHLIEIDGQFRPSGVVGWIGNGDMLALDHAPEVPKDLFDSRFEATKGRVQDVLSGLQRGDIKEVVYDAVQAGSRGERFPQGRLDLRRDRSVFAVQ